jgi:type II secretory pathway component GspD/PulD (secretin)
VFPKTEGISIVAEEKTNSVLLRGKPDKLRRVVKLIAEREKLGEKT